MNTDTAEERYAALHEGEVYLTDLSLEEAAHEILTYDSEEYKFIQNEEGYFELWSRKQVSNIGWTKTRFSSREEKEEDAIKDIFERVIRELNPYGNLEIMNKKKYNDYCAAIEENEQHYDDDDDYDNYDDYDDYD